MPARLLMDASSKARDENRSMIIGNHPDLGWVCRDVEDKGAIIELGDKMLIGRSGVEAFLSSPTVPNDLT